MSEYVKSKIEERRSRIATLQRELDVLLAEVRAYEDALVHSQGLKEVQQLGPVLVKHPQFFGGGSIIGESHWPELVGRLGANGKKFTIDEVEGELRSIGKSIQRKSIRAKLAVLAKKGRLRRVKDGVYRLVPDTKDQEAA